MIRQGLNSWCQKWGDGLSAPLCHSSGTGVGVRWDPSPFCIKAPVCAPCSSRKQRRTWGGHGPPSSTATVPQLLHHKGVSAFPEERGFGHLTVKTVDSFRRRHQRAASI